MPLRLGIEPEATYIDGSALHPFRRGVTKRRFDWLELLIFLNQQYSGSRILLDIQTELQI